MSDYFCFRCSKTTYCGDLTSIKVNGIEELVCDNCLICLSGYTGEDDQHLESFDEKLKRGAISLDS